MVAARRKERHARMQFPGCARVAVPFAPWCVLPRTLTKTKHTFLFPGTVFTISPVRRSPCRPVPPFWAGSQLVLLAPVVICQTFSSWFSDAFQVVRFFELMRLRRMGALEHQEFAGFRGWTHEHSGQSWMQRTILEAACQMG